MPEGERAAARTQLGIFVVHNKRKDKLGAIPEGIQCVFTLPITRAPLAREEMRPLNS
jgi:hypothetical protein